MAVVHLVINKTELYYEAKLFYQINRKGNKIMLNKEEYLNGNTILSAEKIIIISGRRQKHLRLLFGLIDVYVPPDVRRRKDYRKNRPKRQKR